jgi:tRNA(Ile)-lysidine synthase
MVAARNKPSTDLADHVAAFFAPRLQHGRRVCVGLSGGRDSVALLHALATIRVHTPLLELSALHVHHGLSAQADQWAEFCAALCHSLDIPCQLVRVSVSGIAEEGLEAAARRARYAAFVECDTDWLALAHHRDDQAETLMLNLLRGAGVAGLSAMPEQRALADTPVRLVRPLLAMARRDIEHWLKERRLAWIEDESNADTRLRRNYLRHEILPSLAGHFPDPAVSLARAAAHLAEHAALAEEIAVADAAGLVDGESIQLDGLNALPPARRANLLRFQFRRQGLRMPDSRHLQEILRQLTDAAADAAPEFVLDGARLRVSRGRLHCSSSTAVSSSMILWQGEATLAWAGGLLHFELTEGRGLSRMRLAAAPVSIRTRLGGERLQLDAKRPRRSLKHLFQESDVPVWERENLPLLWCGEDLAWVSGLGCDAGYLARPGEAGVLPIWRRD